MPGVIRICGDRVTLDSATAGSRLSLVESAKCQRERRLHPDAVHSQTTYNLAVSDADGDAVPQQVAEADRFLEANKAALSDLMKAVPDGEWSLDFSWDYPLHAAGQCNAFPPAFLARLAELRMTLVVSVYGTEDG